MKLRPYQKQLSGEIDAAWSSHRNVLAVSPTGSGKTATFAQKIQDEPGHSVAIAHRQELVAQIAGALGRVGIPHGIIAPRNVIKFAVRSQTERFGRSFFDPRAKTVVAGVDTLVRRREQLADFLPRVKLWVMDEAHHVLEANKWGTACGMFPNARGLGVTATPTRADGRGLGRHADGVFDEMVHGPGMRALINAGYMTDYRIVAPESHFDRDALKVSATTGDFTTGEQGKQFKHSGIVGDVVKAYQQFAPGKRGVTFTPDVESAEAVAAQFRAAGVPALAVSAKTPDVERAQAVKDLESGKLLQLVNCDLFGEGFDLPAIEVVSMARATQSFALFAQQFGRALRLVISPLLESVWDTFTDAQRRQFIAESAKPSALIIDHVGNVAHHLPPDAPREFTLDRREARGGNSGSSGVPVRSCDNPACASVYERVYKCCPYCGHYPEPAERRDPQTVDGDLTELDPEVLALLRGEVLQENRSVEQYAADLQTKRLPHVAYLGNVNRYKEKLDSRAALLDAISWWGGYQRAQQRPDSESYRRFFLTFGVDVLTAQTLPRKATDALTEKINSELVSLGVDRSVNSA